MLQVFLDQNRSFKRASGEFALRVAICILWRSALLLFHANEHFREKEAFELLPRLAVFADSHSSIEPQSPKSTFVSKGAMWVGNQRSVGGTYLWKSSPCQLSTLMRRSSVISSKTSVDSNGQSTCRLCAGDFGRLLLYVSLPCCADDTVGAPRISDGSGLHLPSGTSMVTRQVRLCCCLERLSVGNSLLTVTVGAGIGFLVMLARGLLIAVSMDWTS